MDAIFYRANDNPCKEHFLNTAAALVQRSSVTHVELALNLNGDLSREMSDVVRVFAGENVEIASRQGFNPQFTYIELSTSRPQVIAMCNYAHAQVGKPFSMSGMARSWIYPRQTNNKSFFCSELTAAVLQHGGWIPTDVNPASFTPASLYEYLARVGNRSANPVTLRNMKPKQNTSIVFRPPMNSQHLAPRREDRELTDERIPLYTIHRSSAHAHAPAPQNMDAELCARVFGGALRQSGVMRSIANERPVRMYETLT
jgi:hypothetical protein